MTAADARFWRERWEHGQTGFHQPGGHPLLATCWPRLGLADNARVLVPLCGKSPDMQWLAARGHRVTGVEYSDRAAREFFAEQHIEPESSREGVYQRYAGGGVEILVGDFFDLRPGARPAFDAFYDRAALIALVAEQHRAYARRLRALMGSAAAGALITLDYDPAEMDGPPYPVGPAEVADLFAGASSTLLAENTLPPHDHLRQKGLSSGVERVWRIRMR